MGALDLDTIESRLAEIDRERAELLAKQREQLGTDRRKRPVSLRKLAEEMGVKERPLVDAARDGKLRAWRIGGGKRGELVTTLEDLEAYIRTQPAAVERKTASEAPTKKPRLTAKELYQQAVDRARRP